MHPFTKSRKLNKGLEHLEGQASKNSQYLLTLICNSFCTFFLQALNLSCTVWGDPTPEVSWLKNEKPFVSDANCILRFEHGKNVSFTISTVSTHDSGKYSIVVKNSYGTETSDVTVSVYIPEEERESEQEKTKDKKTKA